MYKKLILSLAFTAALVTTCYAATVIYRSVGPGATDPLASGTSSGYTLSISGSTATFSGDIPSNVGVGDAIQYDSDDGGTIDSICFIHGRTDAHTYTVKNAAGAAPTATSVADYDWAIFRAYTLLQNAEDGSENPSIDDAVEDFDTWWGGRDLVTNDEQWNIACYANGTTADGRAVISDWTTDADNYLYIYTPTSSSEVGVSQRHSGTWDDTKYHMEMDDDVFQIYNSYVKVAGLQVRIIDTSPWVEGFRVNSAGYVWISDNIVKGAGPDSRWAIEIQDAVTGKIYVWNNICYKVANGINDYSGAGVKVYVYNNTFVNCRDTGIATGSTSNMVAKNNIVQGCPVGYAGTFDGASDYNISDLTDAPGSQSKQSTTVSFMHAADYDFHLALADTAAIYSGANLTNDSELPFSDDIDGNSRLSTGAWDIGADQTITSIYRSAGVGATSPLASGGSNALTISGSTASFNSDLPSNVGVGDALQYDSDNGGTIDSICFIHGRTDARHYTVKNAAGNPPTATSSPDNDWAIYRAYTSLYDAERGVENTGINDTVENFDTWSDGRDLVTNNEQWNIACYANGTAADTTRVGIYDWTTAADNFIRIYTPVSSAEVGVSQRHQGKWDTGKYRLECSTSGEVIGIGADYVRLDGLQMKDTLSGAQWPGGITINVNNANSDIRISNNILWAALSVSNYGCGITSYSAYSNNAKIWNNMFYDWTGSTGVDKGIYVGSDVGQTKNWYVYNNTFHNCEVGIQNSGSGATNLIAKNNIVKGSGDTNAYVGTFTSGTDYNATDGTDDIGQGTHNLISQTFSFVDEANDDFHLAPLDSGAQGHGVNLSQDPDLAFSDDIDGQARIGPWDIGADKISKSVVRNAVIRNATVR